MPTYDYLCKACGERLELYQSMSEAPKRKCPKCARMSLERQIGAGAGFLFKGGGFYQTDYRSDSYKAAAKAEQNGGSTASEAKSGDSKAGDSKTSDSKASEGANKKADAPKPKSEGGKATKSE